MKNLNGFSLAEVLISVAIIGVIASLTLPTLNTNIQKTYIGPSLAKAVNTLENSNRNALAQKNARKLTSIIHEASGETYLNILDKQTNGFISDSYLGDDRSYEGGSYFTKDGMTYSLNNVVPEEMIDGCSSNKYACYYWAIDIDINGAKKPNKFLRDIFTVYVDTSGSVIVPGSREDRNFYSGGYDLEHLTVKNCAAGYVVGADEQTDIGRFDLLYCAGLISDNGWQVPW